MSDTITEIKSQPVEGTCEHCKQTRPLFPYELDHGGHIDPYGFTCSWCNRGKQPMLCVRCWSVERTKEEHDPKLNEEAAMWSGILATNTAHVARRKRDKATVAGIAAASGMSGE